MKANKRIIAMMVGALTIGLMVVGCEKKEVKDESTQTQQVVATEEKEDLVVEEVDKVMYDKENIKITCMSIEKDGRYAKPLTTVKLKVENNSDEQVTVQNDTVVTVNDSAELSGSLVEDLKANESKEVEFVFYDETDFKENGIEEIEKMQMNLMVLNSSYYVLDEDVVTLDLTK